MARGRGNHRFASVGALDIKGLDETLDAHELRWEPLESISPLPLPGRLSGDHGFGFVGRQRQRAAAEAGWEQSGRGGRRSVVLLAGEAGIGKTRLANELAGRLTAKEPWFSTAAARRISRLRTGRGSTR